MGTQGAAGGEEGWEWLVMVLDVGSILLSTAWLWELPPLWDPLPLLFLPPSVITSFPVCKMPYMLFLQVNFVS